jgi:hypothetical protein
MTAKTETSQSRLQLVVTAVAKQRDGLANQVALLDVEIAERDRRIAELELQVAALMRDAAARNVSGGLPERLPGEVATNGAAPPS